MTRRRRQQMLEAAVETIAERGFADTRIADVAGKAGASPALVLYYFDSKEHLLTEALTFAEDAFYLSIFHELTALGSARARLLRLIELSLGRGDGDAGVTGDWILWMELWTRALRDPEAAQKRQALDRRWRSTIADIVRSGQESGEFEAVDVESFTLTLATLMDGCAIQMVLGDNEASPERVRRICMDVAARTLGFDVDESLGRLSSTETREMSTPVRR
jgi:AcrR family transcriptional regulator